MSKSNKRETMHANNSHATNVKSKALIELVRHFAYFRYLRTLSQRPQVTGSLGVLGITSTQSLFLSETDTLHAEGGNDSRMEASHTHSD